MTWSFPTKPTDINYLQLQMVADGAGTIALNNLQLNGNPLTYTGDGTGNFGEGNANGYGNFYVANNSLLNGFTLTGSINWNGISGSAGERPKIEFDLGNSALVPEPTTMIAGAFLLLPFGASTLRMLRKSRTA